MNEETKTADHSSDSRANPFRSPSGDKSSSQRGGVEKQSLRTTLRRDRTNFRVGTNGHHTNRQSTRGTGNAATARNCVSSTSSRRRRRSRSSQLSSQRLLMPLSGNNGEEEKESADHNNNNNNNNSIYNDEANTTNRSTRGNLAPSHLVHRKRTSRFSFGSNRGTQPHLSPLGNGNSGHTTVSSVYTEITYHSERDMLSPDASANAHCSTRVGIASSHLANRVRTPRFSVGSRGSQQRLQKRLSSPLRDGNSGHSTVSSYTEITYHSDGDIVSSDADEVSISDCSSSFCLLDRETIDRTIATNADVPDRSKTQTDARADGGRTGRCSEEEDSSVEINEWNSVGRQPLTNTSQRTMHSFFSLNELGSTGTISSLSLAEGDDSYQEDDSIDDDSDTRDSNTDGEEEKKYYHENKHQRRMEIAFASLVAKGQQQHQSPLQNRRSRGRSCASSQGGLPDGMNEHGEEGCKIFASSETDTDELAVDEAQSEVGEESDHDVEQEEEYQHDKVLNSEEREEGNEEDYFEEYIIESLDDESVLVEKTLEQDEDEGALLASNSEEEWELEVEAEVGESDNEEE